MRRLCGAGLLVAIACASGENLLAQVPPGDAIPNWPVPATWSAAADTGGLQTMTDASPLAVPLIAVVPCRIADTRTGQGFSGQAGPPILPSNTTRTFQIGGTPTTVPPFPNGCAGGTIPTSAIAVSFQFTVVSPSADGNLIAWPAGTAQPQVSVLNWPAGTVALGNGTIVALGIGSLAVRLNMAIGQTAHLVIDVNGYFTRDLTSQQQFGVSGNAPILAAFQNGNTSSHSYAVFGNVASPIAGSAGIGGMAVATSGSAYGGWFKTLSAGNQGGGAMGVSGHGEPSGLSGDCGYCYTSGLRGVDAGQSTSYGVLGISGARGVAGVLTDTTSSDASDAEGYLGYRSGATVYGVLSLGGSGGTGIKSFIEPHATDPSKVIRYVSLEGPEAGTYFRGKGKFVRGIATIEVPEDFRMVTDREGLSIQVTPIGEMASVAVLSIGLDRIVVKGSRNVEFFYLVHGVRATFKDYAPIGDGIEFRPTRETAVLPGYLSRGQKQLLIRNGTYKADGTVNMETARRLGWDRVWEETRTPRPLPEGSVAPTNP